VEKQILNSFQIASSAKNTDSLREKQGLKSLFVWNWSSLPAMHTYKKEPARPTHTHTNVLDKKLNEFPHFTV